MGEDRESERKTGSKIEDLDRMKERYVERMKPTCFNEVL